MRTIAIILGALLALDAILRAGMFVGTGVLRVAVPAEALAVPIVVHGFGRDGPLPDLTIIGAAVQAVRLGTLFIGHRMGLPVPIIPIFPVARAFNRFRMIVGTGVLRVAVPADALLRPAVVLGFGRDGPLPDLTIIGAAVQAVRPGTLFIGRRMGLPVPIIPIFPVARAFNRLRMIVGTGVLRVAGPADALLIPAVLLRPLQALLRVDRVKPETAVQAVRLGALVVGDGVRAVSIVRVDGVALLDKGLRVLMRAAVFRAAARAAVVAGKAGVAVVFHAGLTGSNHLARIILTAIEAMLFALDVVGRRVRAVAVVAGADVASVLVDLDIAVLAVVLRLALVAEALGAPAVAFLAGQPAGDGLAGKPHVAVRAMILPHEGIGHRVRAVAIVRPALNRVMVVAHHARMLAGIPGIAIVAHTVGTPAVPLGAGLSGDHLFLAEREAAVPAAAGAHDVVGHGMRAVVVGAVLMVDLIFIHRDVRMRTVGAGRPAVLAEPVRAIAVPLRRGLTRRVEHRLPLHAAVRALLLRHAVKRPRVGSALIGRILHVLLKVDNIRARVLAGVHPKALAALSACVPDMRLRLILVGRLRALKHLAAKITDLLLHARADIAVGARIHPFKAYVDVLPFGMPGGMRAGRRQGLGHGRHVRRRRLLGRGRVQRIAAQAARIPIMLLRLITAAHLDLARIAAVRAGGHLVDVVIPDVDLILLLRVVRIQLALRRPLPRRHDGVFVLAAGGIAAQAARIPDMLLRPITAAHLDLARIAAVRAGGHLVDVVIPDVDLILLLRVVRIQLALRRPLLRRHDGAFVLAAGGIAAQAARIPLVLPVSVQAGSRGLADHA